MFPHVDRHGSHASPRVNRHESHANSRVCGHGCRVHRHGIHVERHVARRELSCPLDMIPVSTPCLQDMIPMFFPMSIDTNPVIITVSIDLFANIHRHGSGASPRAMRARNQFMFVVRPVSSGHFLLHRVAATGLELQGCRYRTAATGLQLQDCSYTAAL